MTNPSLSGTVKLGSGNGHVMEYGLLPAAVAPGNPAIAEHIILPCLTILVSNLGSAPTAAGAAAPGAPSRQSTASSPVSPH